MVAHAACNAALCTLTVLHACYAIALGCGEGDGKCCKSYTTNMRQSCSLLLYTAVSHSFVDTP